MSNTKLMEMIGGIDQPLLTDEEYEALKEVAANILATASKGLSSPGPDFERIYGKGYANGYAAALAEFPALAREIIAKATGTK